MREVLEPIKDPVKEEVETLKVENAKLRRELTNLQLLVVSQVKAEGGAK